MALHNYVFFPSSSRGQLTPEPKAKRKDVSSTQYFKFNKYLKDISCYFKTVCSASLIILTNWSNFRDTTHYDWKIFYSMFCLLVVKVQLKSDFIRQTESIKRKLISAGKKIKKMHQPNVNDVKVRSQRNER